MLVFIIAAIAIALLAIAFALQNPAPVVVQFLAWQVEDSLAVVLLLTLAIGALIGLLVCIPTLIRRSMQLSRQKRQIAQFQSEIEARRQDLSSQTQFSDTLQQQLEERLAAFGAIDPPTGLVQYQYMPQVCTYLLQQMRQQTDNPQYASLSVLLIQITQVQSSDGTTTLPVTEPIAQAISTSLRSRAYPETWLHTDGRDRFACITSGLSATAAADYGEMLRARLNELSVDLANGTKVKVNASLGGALADLTHPVDGAEQLLEHAETALNESQTRGHDRFAWFRLGLDRLMWN